MSVVYGFAAVIGSAALALFLAAQFGVGGSLVLLAGLLAVGLLVAALWPKRDGR